MTLVALVTKKLALGPEGAVGVLSLLHPTEITITNANQKRVMVPAFRLVITAGRIARWSPILCRFCGRAIDCFWTCTES